MGISIDGHMIVGALGSSITLPEGYNYMTEWAEEHHLDMCALWYDAPCSHTIYGYKVDDIKVENIDQNFIVLIRHLGDKFHSLTGVQATLYGAPSVW